MGDEPTTGETRAERIKRTWDEGEPERAARRAEREVARQPELEAVGLRRRMGNRLVGLGWHLLFTLITLAAVVLPTLVAWVLIGSEASAMVGGAMIGIVVIVAVMILSAGTKYSGDW